jgi:hypothetical protein
MDPSDAEQGEYIGFRLSADLKEAVETEARAQERSVSGMLRFIVTQWYAAKKGDYIDDKRPTRCSVGGA